MVGVKPNKATPVINPNDCGLAGAFQVTTAIKIAIVAIATTTYDPNRSDPLLVELL
jgi:hypothetical protein